MPHLGNEDSLWMNGIYDSLCIIVFFPLIVYLGASGQTTDRKSSAICKFMGDISYPVYVVHYPSMYLFYSWMWDNGLTFGQTWHVAAGLFVGNIVLAYICLKCYDEPLRKYLTGRFQSSHKSNAC